MKKTFYQSVTLAILLFIVLGGIYPLLTTFIGRILFLPQANGSIIYIHNIPVGSKLIGQKFTKNIYFHSRPSSAGHGYDATNSSPSNFSQTNKNLYHKVSNSIQKILAENPTIKVTDIPNDLVTSSGSGLDPDISIQAAYIQIPRIAKARKLNEDIIKSLVDQKTKKPIFSFIGQKRVNVLELNLELDKIKI